ncbi:chromate transporter [Clostridium sp. D2Q-11]|uniref:Chromate transporter n=1 Tax=Anaeromonas frigoriresistens TaxID=2683708 RepID=A0A942Z8J8_9FIRM|nr:chromate transporter [Anaeromonas frigoriresistens]MBS4538343.1 chromate transporter [Anaeromonas frigoriresistens]
MKEALKFFIIFFKLGVFTIGGGYAMIPLIQAEVVDKNNWLDNDEFLDTIAVAQSAPGAIAINASILIGYKLKKIPGAIACALGVSLPSFLIILFIVKYIYNFRDNEIVAKVFKGITPAVVGLIAASLYRLIKASKIKGLLLIIPLLALIAIVIFGISPVYIILLAAFGSIGYHKLIERKES